MWKGNKWDVFTLLITYFVSLLKGMEIGLLVGVLVNIVYLLHLTARPTVEIRRIKVVWNQNSFFCVESKYKNGNYFQSSTGCEYVLVSPATGLSYISISYLKDIVYKAATVDGENVLPVIIDCNKFQSIDYSACVVS